MGGAHTEYTRSIWFIWSIWFVWFILVGSDSANKSETQNTQTEP